MDHPPPLYLVADVCARFRGLARGKQVALVGLNGLGLLLLVVTCLYVMQPDGSAAASHDTAVAAGALAYTTPVVAGQFVLQDGTLGQTIITLRQFGDALTGIATSATCAHGTLHTTQRLITGQLLAKNQMQLTFTSPNQPHSTSIAYDVVITEGGLTLTWADVAGHQQAQQWQRVLGEDALANPCR